ncbi:MAG: hypothetical protein KGR26_00415, partial [Cyanobacteria bacterium REEB65]|nr:hypothetical protein [Cyanobacteria bacterium REEB65]
MAKREFFVGSLIASLVAALSAGCGSGGYGTGLLGSGSTAGLRSQSVAWDGNSDPNSLNEFLFNHSEQGPGAIRLMDWAPKNFSNLALTPEASASIVAQTGLTDTDQVSMATVFSLILQGALEVDDSNPDGPSNTAYQTYYLTTGKQAPSSPNTFQDLLDQRNYYANAPQDGLPYWQNQQNVAKIDQSLLKMAVTYDKVLLDSDPTATCSELTVMRSYYDDPRHPPADGQPVSYHYAQLMTVAQDMFAVAEPATASD